MASRFFLCIYLGGLVVISIVRIGYVMHRDKREPVARVHGVLDSILMGLTGTGLGAFPLLVAFTDWLAFADYRLPAWAGWVGVVVYMAALILLWRSHADLGVNWSPKVEAKQDQQLVTRGVYRWVRHPMYAAHWLWAAAQALLVANWLAGPAFLVTFWPLYLVRVPREERMLEARFGDEYRRYARCTGRIVPRMGRAQRP